MKIISLNIYQQSSIYIFRKRKTEERYIRGAFNKFPDFFVQAFKMVVDP